MRVKTATLDRIKVYAAISGISYSDLLDRLMDAQGIPKMSELNDILKARMAIKSPLQGRTD